MLTFISHSFKDEAVYSTLCLALDASGVKRWDPQSMSPGELLALRLQSAITDCNLCVFIATRRAIESPWCAAELGAFWGAGKKVLLFMADPDLEETTLPPQFKGTLRVDNANALIAAIKKAEEAYTYSNNVNALNPTFYASSAEYGSERDWDIILAETENSFDLLGLTLDQWRNTNRFKEKILAKASSGCKARFLLMHQENPILTSLFRDEELELVRRNIRDSTTALTQLQAAHENILVRQLRNGVAYFSLTRSDRLVVVTQYLSSGNWGYGPTWRSIKDSALFKAAVGEFEHLWEASA